MRGCGESAGDARACACVAKANTRHRVALPLPRHHPPRSQIRDVDVTFPFVPYPCQRDFMDSLIDALQKQDNALLESPTGTGKVRAGVRDERVWESGKRERASHPSFLLCDA